MPSPLATQRLTRRELADRVPISSPDRLELCETFAQRPIAAGDLDPSTINQAAVRLLTGANRNFIVSGTNAVTGSANLHASGGVALATAGALNDQVIVSPATAINSVDQSLWRSIQWQPGDELLFEVNIELPSIADVRVHAGLGLTAALNLTTDDDYAKLVLDTATSTQWLAASSTGGTDTSEATDTPAKADANVRLRISTDSDGVARFAINGVDQRVTRQLTAAASLLPMVGIQTLTTAAKTMYLRDIRLGRKRHAA